MIYRYLTCNNSVIISRVLLHPIVANFGKCVFYCDKYIYHN